MHWMEEVPFCMHLNPVCSAWRTIPLLRKRFVKVEGPEHHWRMEDTTVLRFPFEKNMEDISTYVVEEFM